MLVTCTAFTVESECDADLGCGWFPADESPTGSAFCYIANFLKAYSDGAYVAEQACSDYGEDGGSGSGNFSTLKTIIQNMSGGDSNDTGGSEVAMTGATTNGYTASASNEEHSDRGAWKLFNKAHSEHDGWRSAPRGHYDSDGVYVGSANLGSDSGGTAFADADKGEWIQLELPRKLKLGSFTLQPRYSTGWGIPEYIKNGKVWGSNDGTSWSVIHEISGTSAGSDDAITTYEVNHDAAYTFIALVITDTSGGTITGLSEWELFGTPDFFPPPPPPPPQYVCIPAHVDPDPAEASPCYHVFGTTAQNAATRNSTRRFFCDASRGLTQVTWFGDTNPTCLIPVPPDALVYGAHRINRRGDLGSCDDASEDELRRGRAFPKIEGSCGGFDLAGFYARTDGRVGPFASRYKYRVPVPQRQESKPWGCDTEGCERARDLGYAI